MRRLPRHDRHHACELLGPHVAVLALGHVNKNRAGNTSGPPSVVAATVRRAHVHVVMWGTVELVTR